MNRSGRTPLIAVAALTASLACSHSRVPDVPTPAPAASPHGEPRAMLGAWLDALARRDLREIALRLGGSLPVRVEIRQARFETDERTGEMLQGASAFAAWVERTAPGWSCAESSPSCRWPRGLHTDGIWNCFGDCCDIRFASGLRPGALYVRRVCMAGRENADRRLSLLSLVEDR